MTKKKNRTLHTNLGIQFLLGQKIFMDLNSLEFRRTADPEGFSTLQENNRYGRRFDDIK